MLIFAASIILTGIAVFIVMQTVFEDNEQFKAQEKLEEINDKSSEVDHGIVLRYSRPFFKRYVSPIVSGLKNKKQIIEKYKRPLASAGLTDVLRPEDFYSFKLFLIVGFPIVFLALRAFVDDTWPMSLVFVIGPVGFIYPDFWLKGKIDQRRVEIIGNMPFAVDMLALSVEAGLDFMAAMTKVVQKAKRSALTEEFELVIKEQRVGSSRAEALRNLAWRVDIIQVSSFCATLIAADQVGASIGPILKNLAIEIRQKKSAEIEKEASKASTKIMLPTMGFILPAVIFLIMGPIFLQMMQ